MTEDAKPGTDGTLDAALSRWKERYDGEIGTDRDVVNRSGIRIKPIYTPKDWSSENYDQALGMPGEAPFTRGIYATMHRGRTWTQRQLIGLGTPSDYNGR
ncbi:MAG: methylmalonyl-CoA mutase family protein, partial [Roseovarius indicus]